MLRGCRRLPFPALVLKDEESARVAAQMVKDALKEVEFEVVTHGGEHQILTGCDIEFGTGTEREQADRNLYQVGEERRAAGTRTPKGRRPFGLKEVNRGRAEGEKARGDSVPDEGANRADREEELGASEEAREGSFLKTQTAPKQGPARKAANVEKTFVVDSFGKTSIRTYFEGDPTGGAFAVARGPIDFIFSDRAPDDQMRAQLSPLASWEEQPAQIRWTPSQLDIRFDWDA